MTLVEASREWQRDMSAWFQMMLDLAKEVKAAKERGDALQQNKVVKL